MCPRQSAEAVIDAHRVLPEKAAQMVRADLRKPEKRDFQAEIGSCLQRARSWVGWSLKETAAKLGRDERQIARWERGEERTQVDAVFGVPELRQPFTVQLAKLSGAKVIVGAEFTDAA